jgi:hypothetical protein
MHTLPIRFVRLRKSRAKGPDTPDRRPQDHFMMFTRYSGEVVAIKISNPAVVQQLQRYGPVHSAEDACCLELGKHALGLLLRLRAWIKP